MHMYIIMLHGHTPSPSLTPPPSLLPSTESMQKRRSMFTTGNSTPIEPGMRFGGIRGNRSPVPSNANSKHFDRHSSVPFGLKPEGMEHRKDGGSEGPIPPVRPSRKKHRERCVSS